MALIRQIGAEVNPLAANGHPSSPSSVYGVSQFRLCGTCVLLYSMTVVLLHICSGAARALVTGVKLAMLGPPGRVGPSQKRKTSFSPTLLSRGPSRAYDGRF